MDQNQRIFDEDAVPHIEGCSVLTLLFMLFSILIMTTCAWGANTVYEDHILVRSLERRVYELESQR